MLRTSALALACLAAGCHLHVRGSNLVVDGVRLEEKHVETIEVDGWDPQGVRVEASMGDVTIRRDDGGNRITVTLHEKTFGDARAAYEGGRLVSRTASGEPSAIGDVTIYSAASLPSLVVATGMGDVEMDDVTVTGELELSTGMGDVELARFGNPGLVTVSTGMGDVELMDGATGTLRATSGMGDVEITRVDADDASFSSGMGDVDVQDCRFERVDANTGLGDIDCKTTTYERGDFDTGLGQVHRH